MLVDLPTQVWGFTNDPFLRELAARLTDGNAKPERLDKGVYITHLNFSHELQAAGILKTIYPFSSFSIDEIDSGAPSDYGVCDNYHQIIARWWKQLDVPDRKFVISLTEIRRDRQSPEGGWRWHKWGEYIGTESPQWEYLYDEPDIDVVFCFHIIELV